MPEEQGRFRQFAEQARAGAGRVGAYATSAYGHATSTGVGRAFMRGMGEGVGLGFAGKPSIPSWVAGSQAKEAYLAAAPKRYQFTGFLGLGEFKQVAQAEKSAWKAMTPAARRTARATQSGVVKNIAQVKFGGMGGVTTALRALGPVMVGYSMYAGYKEGGVWGAIKGGASELAIWGAFEAGMYVLGAAAAPLAAVAAVGAVGAGAYAYGEAAQAHRKRLRNVEMGGEVFDPFGTAATTRQRSLQALHNSHINGRMAIGSEAVLMHR